MIPHDFLQGHNDASTPKPTAFLQPTRYSAQHGTSEIPPQSFLKKRKAAEVP